MGYEGQSDWCSLQIVSDTVNTGEFRVILGTDIHTGLYYQL